MQSDLTPQATTSYKTYVAFGVAFLTALVTTIQGRTDLDSMSVQQWLVVVLSALVTAGAVWTVPNTPKV